jgi:hypothetical protein
MAIEAVDFDHNRPDNIDVNAIGWSAGLQDFLNDRATFNAVAIQKRIQLPFENIFLDHN